MAESQSGDPRTRKTKRRKSLAVATAASLLAPMLFTASVDAVTITSANDVDITQVVLQPVSGSPIIQNASQTLSLIHISEPTRPY